MEQIPEEMQKRPNMKKGALMDARLRNLKDIVEDRYIIVRNMEELWNNSVSKDRIKIKGNISMTFYAFGLPELEVEGNLKCKTISSENGIYVDGDIKGRTIHAKSIKARNITCSHIACGEITAYESVVSNRIAMKRMNSPDIFVAEEVLGTEITTKTMYAREAKVSHITATEIEAEYEISCEFLKAKKAKAGSISAARKEIEEETITGKEAQKQATSSTCSGCNAPHRRRPRRPPSKI